LHRSILVLIVTAILALAAPARAADPIMPLSEVRSGMLCTGYSVVRGTEIASFDVEVLDVIADDALYGGARLLVRVSGPAVDATGVGPGFSGSPILCAGRNAGAISEGIGEYGNRVVLATPIESILGARPAVPAGARRAPGIARAARPLVGPLTVGGLSPRTRQLFVRAAARADRTVLVAPPGPQGGYPVQDLRPGAAVGAALSTGDVSLGAVGTVAYRDGDQIFAFGHALDGAGRRSLFLQDSYVFGVIGNPLGGVDFGAITYKLTASGGHPVGTVTNDALSAVTGTVGPPPASIPLHVTARMRGSGERVSLDARLANERELGYGAGFSLIAPLAASTATDRLLGSFQPSALTVCTRFYVKQRRKPIGVCNPYFDAFTPLLDIATVSDMIDFFDLAPLDIRRASVRIAVRRGFESDVVVGAEAPRVVRPGSTIAVRVKLRRRGGTGSTRTRTVRVRVPRDLRPGPRRLLIAGNGNSAADEGFFIEIVGELLGFDEEFLGGPREPRTVAQLAEAVADVHRPLGIEARWRRRDRTVVFESDEVLYEGRTRLTILVTRARR
jgi:hypothetical protein